MPLKIAGIIAITASCTMLGFELSSHLIKRVHILETWQQILQRMAGLVRYAKTPLYEMYETFAKEKNEVGAFFTSVLKCGNENTAESWKKNMAKMQSLSKSDTEILMNLAKGLGKGDTDTQIKDIEFALCGIETALNQAKTVSARDTKMYRSISFFAGVCIAIMLV